jgi:hypothetical protein
MLILQSVCKSIFCELFSVGVETSTAEPLLAYIVLLMLKQLVSVQEGKTKYLLC